MVDIIPSIILYRYMYSSGKTTEMECSTVTQATEMDCIGTYPGNWSAMYYYYSVHKRFNHYNCDDIGIVYLGQTSAELANRGVIPSRHH